MQALFVSTPQRKRKLSTLTTPTHGSFAGSTILIKYKKRHPCHVSDKGAVALYRYAHNVIHIPLVLDLFCVRLYSCQLHHPHCLVHRVYK